MFINIRCNEKNDAIQGLEKRISSIEFKMNQNTDMLITKLQKLTQDIIKLKMQQTEIVNNTAVQL